MDDRLGHKEIFNYAFPALRNISRIEAPDNTFRIFTFMVQYADGHYDNYGFTQFEDKKNDRIHVAQLTDNKPEFKLAETRNYGKKTMVRCRVLYHPAQTYRQKRPVRTAGP